MTPEEVERAKQILRSDPTRPRYQGDETVNVRAADLTGDAAALIPRFAEHVGVSPRRAGIAAIRAGESYPRLCDLEFRFPLAVVDG